MYGHNTGAHGHEMTVVVRRGGVSVGYTLGLSAFLVSEQLCG